MGLPLGRRLGSSYLAVQTGSRPDTVVQGGSTVAGHLNEIAAFDWCWGAAQNSALADAETEVYKPLVVFKSLDCATPRLLNLLRSNATLFGVGLTMMDMKDQMKDLFTIALGNVRLTEIDYTIDYEMDPGGILVERLSFTLLDDKGTVKVTYANPGGRGPVDFKNK